MSEIYRIDCAEYDGFLAYHGTPKVVVFYTSSCAFCRSQIAVLDRLASSFPAVECAIANVEHDAAFCIEHQITAVPTTMLCLCGKTLKRFDRFQPLEVLEKELCDLKVI